MDKKTTNHFYGRFRISLFFFVWTLLFFVLAIIVAIVVVILQFTLQPFRDDIPLAVKIIAPCVLLGFSLIFTVPALFQTRGMWAKKKVLRHGKLVFGGRNISVSKRTIRQNLCPMYVAYTLSFTYEDKNYIHHVRQFVKGGDAGDIASVPSDKLPLRVYFDRVVFDEKAFSQIKNGTFDKKKMIQDNINESKQDAQIAKNIYKKTLEEVTKKASLPDCVFESEEDKIYVEGLYERLNQGENVVFKKEDKERLVSIRKHNNSYRLYVVLGACLLAFAKNNNEAYEAYELLRLPFREYNPVACGLLASYFSEFSNKGFSPRNDKATLFLISIAYLLTGKSDKRFELIKKLAHVKENEYGGSGYSQILLGAYVRKIIDNNLDKVTLLELARLHCINDKDRYVVVSYLCSISETLRNQFASVDSNFKNFEGVDVTSKLEDTLYDMANLSLSYLSDSSTSFTGTDMIEHSFHEAMEKERMQKQ